MNHRAARAIIFVIVIVLVLVTVIPLLNDANIRSKEIVETEVLACVVAACVSDKTIGNECIVIRPRVSKIRITVDSLGYRRVQVLPTEADCSQTSP